MTVALLVLLGLPLAGALAVAALPMPDRAAARAGVAVTLPTFAAALGLLAGFDYGRSGTFQAVVDQPWAPSIGLTFHLGVDGVSLPLVALTALLSFLCAVYTLVAPPEAGRVRSLTALLLLLEVGVLGTFVALDLVLFFLFFEVVLVPMYFVIARWGGEGRGPAATKFVLYTVLGSGFVLVGFLVVYAYAGTFDMAALARMHGGAVPHTAQVLAMALVLIGFGVKSPMWPLHTWLPDAHTEAPTVGSVLLAGVLLKMGTYGLVRVGLGEVPYGARQVAPFLGAFAAVGIVYGALCCLGQRDLKRLVAYSSVGHMGFVLLGIATLTPVGVNAALLGNIAHGVITGLLFFLVGSLKDRYHTVDIAELGGGVLAAVPVLGGLVTFAAVASLGLPGLAGFWGEMLAMLGAYRPEASLSQPLFLAFLALAALGTVLTAAYFLVMVRRVVLGVVPERWRAARIGDVATVELLAWAPLVALAVGVGVYPRLVLGVTDAAVRGLLGGGR